MARRLKYLNLFKIRLPVTGVVSLAHRASGVLLFISIPFCIWLLERSLSSAADFAAVQQLLSEPLVKLTGFVLCWALLHHFFAGIRFLLIDVDIGVHKSQSRIGAWLVIAAEIVVMLLVLRAWL